MNSDWETIGEKVFSLYKNMEYCTDESSEYTVQQFEADLEIEKKKKLAPQLLNEKFNSEDDSYTLSFIPSFRKAIDGRRSILKKFFSFGNYVNGVDIFIEYCDSCKAYRNLKYKIYYPPLISVVFSMILKYLGENKKTIEKKLCLKVWELLRDDIHSMGFFTDEKLSVDEFHPTAIVIMADSDLNAAVNALIKWKDSCLRVSHILVQEPIREKFVNIIPDQDNKKWIIDNLFVFRNIGEAIGYLNSSKNLLALSVWSENIIGAKNFSADLEVDTIWINTHGDISPGFYSIAIFDLVRNDFPTLNLDEEKKIDNSLKNILNTLGTVDLFYGGKWEVPIEGKYWTDESGFSFAQATIKDLDKCSVEARKAFKIWRSTKLSQRIKVVKFFAERFRAHGESEYADKILQFANSQLLDSGNTLSIVRDGEAEITTTLKPVGVILFSLDNQDDLFEYLTVAVLTGNTVIILIKNKSGVKFSPYCDMLAGSGFPPGVINCLFTEEDSTKILNEELKNVNRIIAKSFPNDRDLFNRMLRYFTKPQSVWLQRG